MSRADFKKHFNKGRQLAGRNKFSEAILEFEAALAYKPSDPNTIFQLGNMAKAMQLYDLAIKWYDVAIQLKPTSVEIAFNRALALQLTGRNQDALDAYTVLVPLMQDNAMLWNGLGVLYQQMSMTLEAIEALEKATALKRDYFEAWNNLALSYFIARSGPTFGDEWKDAFNKAEKGFKGRAEFHVNRASCYFWEGDYHEAWSEFKYRHKPDFKQSVIYHHEIPWWKGEDLSGKTLLIGEEQGMGDQLSFLSALRDIESCAGRVILEVSHKLVDLARRNFPNVQVVEAKRETIDMRRHHYYDWLDTPVDFFAPLGDAFYNARPSVAAFPMQRSFLTADSERAAKWKKRLDAVNDKPKIGISWRSSKVSGARQGAYFQLKEIAPLLEKFDQYQFVNLQYGDCREELASIQSPASDRQLIKPFDDLDLFDDIENTCALIDNLDFVISARNTQMCFAGALGVKTISFRGSHFQFGYVHADPIYTSSLSIYPHPDYPPILEQFEAALEGFETTFADYTKISGEYPGLLEAGHPLLAKAKTDPVSPAIEDNGGS